MTQPETCGAAGGAVSLWMKLVECPDWAGVISSWTRTTGFVIYCASGNFTRYIQLFGPLFWLNLVYI